MSLVSADVSLFEVIVRRRAKELGQSEPDAEAIGKLFTELSGSALADNEKSRRAGRIAELLPATPPFQAALANAAARATTEIRAAIVAVLPAEMQRAAYTGEMSGTTQARTHRESHEAGSTSTSEPDTGEGEDWRSVLLFGSSQDVAANTQLLRNRGFKAIRIANPEDAEVLEGEQVCGLVFHRTWWASFSETSDLLTFIRSRLSRSNLLYIKLDCRGLGDDEEKLAQVLTACDVEVQARISSGTDSHLTKLDLKGLEDVAGLLARARGTHIGVEGLSEANRRLVAAAVESFAGHRHLSGPYASEELRVQPIMSGRSGAQVLRIRSAAYKAVFIAKLDILSKLEDELTRTRRSTPSTGPLSADMCLYSLDGKGVLIQQLFADLDRPDQGAPTLKERLAECTAWERGRPGVPEPQLADLEVGVTRTISNIGQVNRVATDDPASNCWTTVETLDSLREVGVAWTITCPEREFDPAALVAPVEEILGAHSNSHVVHGDMNTSNIVMPDARLPNLIDFALAGAGHPCFDLVRFSSGVTYEFLRPLYDEVVLRQFFARLHIDGASKEELRAEFPGLLSGVCPRVAVHALTESRRAALAALPLDAPEALEQYLAMVYLVAAQSLTIDDFQCAVVRSVLSALGPRVEAIINVRQLRSDPVTAQAA